MVITELVDISYTHCHHKPELQWRYFQSINLKTQYSSVYVERKEILTDFPNELHIATRVGSSTFLQECSISFLLCCHLLLSFSVITAMELKYMIIAEVERVVPTEPCGP